MLPEPKDAALLWDMLDAARSIISIAEDLDFEAFASQRVPRRAIEREIEIIGEAARHVSKTYRDAHPHIAWTAIAAQRHRLAHAYASVKLDLIWKVVKVHIPELIRQREPLVPQPPEGEQQR